jgi:hypothetical protein
LEPEAPPVNRRRLEFDLGDRVSLHVAHDQLHRAKARPVSDRGLDDYADRGKGERWPQRPSDISRIGAQPAIEQNDGESDAADQIGGVKVAKEDAAGSLFPGEDAQP